MGSYLEDAGDTVYGDGDYAGRSCNACQPDVRPATFGGKIMELSLGLLIEITRFFATLPGSAVYLYPPEQMLLLVWNISIVAIMSVRGFAL